MYVINKQKIAKACLTASLSLILVNCGFGGRDADPLRGKDEAYVSKIQSDSESEEMQKNFDQQTQEYQNSIAAHDIKIQDLNKKMELTAKKNQEIYNNAQLKTQKQYEAARDKFVADSTVSQKQCQDIQSELNKKIKTLDAMVADYESRNANSEAQEFRGLIHGFEAKGARVQSYSFKSGEKYQFEVEFFLLIGNNAVTGLDFEGERPEGISILPHDSKENTWVFSGIASKEIPNGQQYVETEYKIVPTEPEPSRIKDKIERKRFEDSDEVFELKLRIVTEKSVLSPKTHTVVNDKQVQNPNADFVEIKVSVTDSSSLTDESKPTVIISHNPSGGNNNDKVVNGASMITLDPNVEENPEKVDGVWVFHYVFHKNLASEYFLKSISKDKNVFANFSVQAQSQASGLLSEIDNDQTIKLKGEK